MKHWKTHTGAGVASGFGVASSIAVVFLPVYYSAQIFFLGAELTWTYARIVGSRHGWLEAFPAPELPQRGAEKETRASTDAAASASPTPHKFTSPEAVPFAHPSKQQQTSWLHAPTAETMITTSLGSVS